MIQVHYKENQGSFKELLIQGHADSSLEEGHDLVCAAVSSIAIGGLNALQEIDHYDIQVEDGYVHVKTNHKIAKHDQVVIETMMIQLATIEDSYGEFIKITK